MPTAQIQQCSILNVSALHAVKKAFGPRVPGNRELELATERAIPSNQVVPTEESERGN